MILMFILVFGVSFVTSQKSENDSAIQNCYFSDHENKTFICQSLYMKGTRMMMKYILLFLMKHFLRFRVHKYPRKSGDIRFEQHRNWENQSRSNIQSFNRKHSHSKQCGSKTVRSKLFLWSPKPTKHYGSKKLQASLDQNRTFSALWVSKCPGTESFGFRS